MIKNKELSKQILDAIEEDLLQYQFCERYDDVSENITGAVKKSWNLWRRLSGGHGIIAVISVPESVIDSDELKVFFKDIRKEINSRFVGFAAYKSSHSFIVLICSHKLFVSSSGIASKLKDRTGLHMNIIQGVILVDSQTGEYMGDYTRPAQNKSAYDAVLATISNVLEITY